MSDDEGPTPKNIRTNIYETWAAHQALRLLGFKPDDIYLELSKSYAVVHAVQDGKKFTIGLGDLPCSHDEFAHRWQVFVQKLNKGKFPLKALNKLYAASWVKSILNEVVLGMLKNGIVPPAVMDQKHGEA